MFIFSYMAIIPNHNMLLELCTRVHRI